MLACLRESAQQLTEAANNGVVFTRKDASDMANAILTTVGVVMANR